ncbi:MAG: NirA family protein, partial [Vulcanimicrobiaceae bacterium]
ATDTKRHALAFADELDALLAARGVALEETIGINVTGCPHSCAQHGIAEIGLLGTALAGDGPSREGYHLFVGGATSDFGETARLGRLLRKNLELDELAPALAALLTAFVRNRDAGESFGAFCARRSDDELLAHIAAA